MSQSWHNFKCQFWTLYVAVYLLISIINCHKYHSNVSFLSCISCRGGPNFSMASTSHCNYRLIPTDGYSAHCGPSSFDNVDEVSHLVTCKVFKNNCGASIHICTVGVYYIECCSYQTTTIRHTIDQCLPITYVQGKWKCFHQNQPVEIGNKDVCHDIL